MRLNDFLSSNQSELLVLCNCSVSPDPYEKCLPYIKFVKSNLDSVLVYMDSNFGLVVEGSTELLYIYIEAFKFTSGDVGQHHHSDRSIGGKNNIWPFVESSD